MRHSLSIAHTKMAKTLPHCITEGNKNKKRTKRIGGF